MSQAAKAPVSIFRTVLGITIFLMFVSPAKAPSPMTLTPFGILTISLFPVYSTNFLFSIKKSPNFFISDDTVILLFFKFLQYSFKFP